MPSIWYVFVIILWEGLLGGACYVNAFNEVSTNIRKEHREFSIAVVSIADGIGIALAGFTCNYSLKSLDLGCVQVSHHWTHLNHLFE